MTEHTKSQKGCVIN